MQSPPHRQHSDKCILYFFKVPQMGKVKTRLGYSLGLEKVLDLYKAFVLDCLEVIKGYDCPIHICFSPTEAMEELQEWIGREYKFSPQIGKDLGERMWHHFHQAFEMGYEKVVIIGSDFPALSQQHFDEAFTALDRSDCCIGPALDGGYYLLGLKKHCLNSGIFESIPWSTERVCHLTASILTKNGYKYHFLPMERDIDTIDDLKAFIREFQNHKTVAQRTMALVKDLDTTV